MLNFTPIAQQVLALARNEAEELAFGVVGDGLILIGLLKLNQGLGINTLGKFNITYDSALSLLIELKRLPENQVMGFPYSPAAKKLLALAAKVAKGKGHAWVGTGHILAAMFRLKPNSESLKILQSLGVHFDQFQEELKKEFAADASYGRHSEENPKEPSYSFDVEPSTGLEFTVWVDPGGASVKTIQELFQALSDLNRSHGGNGLSFAREESEHPLAVCCH